MVADLVVYKFHIDSPEGEVSQKVWIRPQGNHKLIEWDTAIVVRVCTPEQRIRKVIYLTLAELYGTLVHTRLHQASQFILVDGSIF